MDAPREGSAGAGWPPRRKIRLTLQGMMVLVLVCAYYFGIGRLFLDRVLQSTNFGRAGACEGHLRAIGLALHAYHQRYGSFPPAFVADAAGQRRHSWRVLILPFLGEHELYAAYRFDEPWDGPNNSRLADRMPRVFACPNRKVDPRTPPLTSYAAVVGRGTAFPGERPTSLGQFADGPGATILVAEVSNVEIPWMAPRDLDLAQMSFKINDLARPGISSFDRDGPLVAFADGGRRRLGPRVAPADLKALLSIKGGEVIDRETLKRTR